MTFPGQHNSYLTNCQTKMSRDSPRHAGENGTQTGKSHPAGSPDNGGFALPEKPLFNYISSWASILLSRVYAPLFQGQEATFEAPEIQRKARNPDHLHGQKNAAIWISYGGVSASSFDQWAGLERVMGLEPTISCLGSKRSTTELHPRRWALYPARFKFSIVVRAGL